MNGHAISKKRGLSDAEKEAIKKMFISCNGIIKDDMAAQMKSSVGKDVSVFQVTGAIVTFHRQVAKGELALKDMESYKAFMDARRAKWASYKSDKYKSLKKRLVKGGEAPAKVLKDAIKKAKKTVKKVKAVKETVLPKRRGRPPVIKEAKTTPAVGPITTKIIPINDLVKKPGLAKTLKPDTLLQEVDKMQIALTQFYKSASLILNSLIKNPS